MERDVPLKTSLEVAKIRKTCRLIECILMEMKSHLRAQMTTQALNAECGQLLLSGGAVPALKGYRGYPAAICTSVNNVAAHGIPGSYALQNDDILTIDISAEIDGWHGDGAWTFIIGEGSPDRRRLLKAAWQATNAGIRAALAGAHLGDVGAAVQETARRHGCAVLDKFVGHGIGLGMHEEPMVLNFGNSGTGRPIVPGMVLTIEPILCLGRPDVHVLDDGWSIVTNDNSLCAQFEHTVAVFRDRTEILTMSGDPSATLAELPPFY